jgi:hypothetical protein
MAHSIGRLSRVLEASADGVRIDAIRESIEADRSGSLFPRNDGESVDMPAPAPVSEQWRETTLHTLQAVLGHRCGGRLLHEVGRTV